MDECTVSNGGNKEEQRKAHDAEQRRRGAQADEIMGLSPNTHTHTQPFTNIILTGKVMIPNSPNKLLMLLTHNQQDKFIV